MFEREKPSIWVRVLISFVLLAIILGGGYAVYRLGYAQGAVAAEGGELILENWSAHPMMDHNFHPYARGYTPRGNIFFGLLFMLMLFGFARRMIFGPRWARWGYGPHRFHGHPRYPGYGDCGPEDASKKNRENIPPDEKSPE